MAMNTTNAHGLNVSGSDTSVDQFGHFIRDLFAGAVSGMAVSQNGTPNLSVNVAPGSAILTKNTVSSVIAEVKATTNVAISTANTSNPRIDAVIVYEDTSVAVTPYINDGAGGRFKVGAVVGTPGASPTAPSDSAIQSEIGAGKPWARLANVTVPTNSTTIINSNISDQRALIVPANLGTNQVTAANLATNAIILGAGTATSNQTVNAGATNAVLTGLTATVTVPAGGRAVQAELYLPQMQATGAAIVTAKIWLGTVGSGNSLQTAVVKLQDSGDAKSLLFMTVPSIISAGSATFTAAVSIAANNTTFTNAAGQVAYLAVKAV